MQINMSRLPAMIGDGLIISNIMSSQSETNLFDQVRDDSGSFDQFFHQ